MAADRISTLQKKRRLPFAMFADANTVVFAYLTFFGPIFPLFLDSLELDKKQIGLLMSLMPFCALIAPFIGASVARFGFKRTFLVFWFLRKVATALLLAVPWVMMKHGAQATYIYLLVSVGLFAFCRAAAETAYYPWNQEFVPAIIRGKYSAINQIVMLIAGAATIAAAGAALGDDPEPRRFVILIMVALGAGVASGLFYTRVPGGAPIQGHHARGTARHAMGLALRDKRFMIYMSALSLVMLGASGVMPFVPLFMKDHAGLAAARVVQLDSAAMLAGLLSTFLWGWAADRYGGKPVMVLGLALFAAYPAGLLLLPRQSELSMPIAFALSAYVGLVNPGWAIGSSRQLFVEIVPEEHKTGYLSLYYAWIGLVGGIGPLLAGRALEMMSHLDDHIWIVSVDAYAPLFATHLLLVTVAVILFSRIRSGGDIGARRFAGMFFQGNPFAALQSLVVHNLARQENDRITSIQRLGDARSPLNVEELIAALEDPSFNVRLEAIVSMSRTRPDTRLTDALIRVVRGPEPDIALAAAWALGRIGDVRAIDVLRERLAGEYPLLAARSARALAQLGARDVIPLLEARLHDELDEGLALAYASALGGLRHAPALPRVLAMLRSTRSPAATRELTLAVGRLISDETYLIRLWRRLQPDPGTSLSEAMLTLRRPMLRRLGHDRDLAEAIDRVIQALADGELQQGAAHLAQLTDLLTLDQFDETVRSVLVESAKAMSGDQALRQEYILLTLCALDAQFMPRG